MDRRLVFDSSGKKPGRAPPQIGDHNLRVTLEAIRRDGPLTRLELGRRSGLTAPGITNILRRLSDDGLITAKKRAEPGGGQPSTEFAINAHGASSVGFWIKEGLSEAVLLDLGGNVRARRGFEVRSGAGSELADVARELMALPEAGARTLGVGIGVEDPDVVDVTALRKALDPVKFTIERDCFTALLAERTFGVGAVEGGVMLVIVDDRVRAGFLLRGLPFRGVHGRAGSIGAMRTGADHVPLDGVVSLTTLRAVMTADEKRRLSRGEEFAPSPAVRGWIREAAGHLLDAIVATAGFLAPGAILIGGELPRNIVDELIAQMSIERGDNAIRPFITPWISPIRPASFPSAGIAIGAALLPFFELLLPSPSATA